MKTVNFLKSIVYLAVLAAAFVVPANAGWLYILNQQNGSPNQIYCFRVTEATGSLDAVPGFPVSTGGNGVTGTQSELLIVDKVNNRLYAINKGSNTVSAFNINVGSGALTPMPFSPFTVVANAMTLAVHPSGSPLIVAGNTGSPLAGTYLADSYNITPTTATRATGAPFSTGGARPFSSTFSRDGSYYYIGGGLSNSWAGFSDDNSTGVLATLSGSPIGAGTTGVLGFAGDSQERLFTATRSDGGLRVYTTSAGTPALASVFGTSFSGLTEGELSPNQQYYVVVDSSSNQMASYKINGSGAGTTLSAAGLAATNGSTANAMAFNTAGTFLFIANSASRSIARITFDPATGTMVNVGESPADSAGASGFLAGLAYVAALPPTAASVSVAGRVMLSQGGYGLKGVTITLVDSLGNTRTALTSPFGYYKFDDLPAGGTLTINAAAKGYVFEPKVLTLLQDVDTFDFVAQGAVPDKKR